MDNYYYDWNKIDDRRPYKGQIIEVLVYRPAIYQGENEFGCHIWDEFEGIDRVVYWRIPKHAPVYEWVQKKLSERR